MGLCVVVESVAGPSSRTTSSNLHLLQVVETGLVTFCQTMMQCDAAEVQLSCSGSPCWTVDCVAMRQSLRHYTKQDSLAHTWDKVCDFPQTVVWVLSATNQYWCALMKRMSYCYSDKSLLLRTASEREARQVKNCQSHKMSCFWNSSFPTKLFHIAVF